MGASTLAAGAKIFGGDKCHVRVVEVRWSLVFEENELG